MTIALAGCSVFSNHYPSVGPDKTGLSAANKQLKAEVHPGVGDSPATFKPLRLAHNALQKARHAGVSARKLSSARTAFQKAKSAWQAINTPTHASGDQLASVSQAAHRAQRLAQIARYQLVTKKNKHRIKQLAGVGGNTSEGAANRQVLVPGHLGVIKFHEGSARLKAQSRRVVAHVASLLQQPNRQKDHVGIAGRTQPISPSSAEVTSFIKANPKVANKTSNASSKRAAYKQALAITRARDIARLLVRKGVSGSRIGLGVSHRSGKRGDVSIELIPANGGS